MIEDRFKFRAWHESTKKMLSSEFVEECFYGKMFDSDMVMMQCTGLKDKSGTLIFEGDAMSPSHYSGKWSRCLVIFRHGMFCFDINGGLIQDARPLHESLCMGTNAGNEYHVVGNKYENPELLS